MPQVYSNAIVIKNDWGVHSLLAYSGMFSNGNNSWIYSEPLSQMIYHNFIIIGFLGGFTTFSSSQMTA